MTSKELGKKLLIGSSFTQKSYSEIKKKITSSVSDNLSQGYEPKQDGSGVLCTFKNVPLAYWGFPTLNKMVFSRALWDNLHENPYIKAQLESHSLYGEERHRDDSEIYITNVACRVNDWHTTDDGLTIGDYDLMDTPNGLICYSLAKTGRIGTSQRGFGSLAPRSDGLSDVVESDYLHSSWDCVLFPACPTAVMSIPEEAALATNEIGNLSQELRRMVQSAYERYPKNTQLGELLSLLSGKYEDLRQSTHKANLLSREQVISLASSKN